MPPQVADLEYYYLNPLYIAIAIDHNKSLIYRPVWTQGSIWQYIVSRQSTGNSQF